jgi:hypothetical protein
VVPGSQQCSSCLGKETWAPSSIDVNLYEVQEFLDKKLKVADERALAYGPIRSGWAASMLRLDAYRQVFEVLINSMTTYKPILRKIKKQYDMAVEDALKTFFENIHMRSEVSMAEATMDRAVDKALTECADSALILRDQLLCQLAETEARAVAAEEQAARQEAAVQDAKQQLYLLQGKSVELRHENSRLQARMLVKTTWSSAMSGQHPSVEK